MPILYYHAWTARINTRAVRMVTDTQTDYCNPAAHAQRVNKYVHNSTELLYNSSTLNHITKLHTWGGARGGWSRFSQNEIIIKRARYVHVQFLLTQRIDLGCGGVLKSGLISSGVGVPGTFSLPQSPPPPSNKG